MLSCTSASSESACRPSSSAAAQLEVEGCYSRASARVVLAHSDATFGFPEIRSGALPGVVSVAARRRLGQAACERLFCTGDIVDAATAHQLGLVDFVGSKAQVEAYVARLTERFMALDPAQILCNRAGPVHQLHMFQSLSKSDEDSQVLSPPTIISPPSFWLALPSTHVPQLLLTSHHASVLPRFIA